MHRIDNATAAAVLPTPDPPGVPGYFTKGDPDTAMPATVVTADWANAVQEEIATAILESGGALDKGARDGLSKAIQRATGGSGNYLLNPEGIIAQHLTDTIAGGALAFGQPDRWKAKTGGAGDSGKLSSGGLGAPLAAAPSRPRTSLRFRKTVEAATGVAMLLQQNVESALVLSDSDVVLAFDAFKFSGANIPITAVEIVQDFGSGGSPSADVVTALSAASFTTVDGTWRRFVYRGHLPGVTGKTFGSAVNDHLKVRITFAANTGVFDSHFSAFVLARGTQDPGYAARDFTTERMLCRRYYETSIDQPSWANFTEDTEPGLWDTAFAGTGLVATLGRRFWVTKRTTPTVQWVAKDGTVNNITEGASTLHPVTASTPSPDHTGYPLITTPPLPGTLRLFRAYYSADAEIPE